MPAIRRISYVLFAAGLALACVLRLGPVLLAGLFAFMMLDLTHRNLSRRLPETLSRWSSVVIFLITAVALGWLFGQFVRLGVSRMPIILGSALPTVDSLASRYGIDLPFENLRELRTVFLIAVRDNARSITETSGLLTRGFFQIVIGLFIAITKFLADEPRRVRGSLLEALGDELDDRMSLFMLSFEKILGTQLALSLINALITLIFLLIAGIPYTHFLVLTTFIFGVVPIVGHLVTNALIVGTALTVSPQHALCALIFLVLSHKLQYFAATRLVGARLPSPLWVTLLAILGGEAVLGVPGLLLAPVIVHYTRAELTAIPSKA